MANAELNFKSWVLTGLFTLLLAQDMLCQNSSLSVGISFRLLDLPGGQAGNHVQAIAQDSTGFLWFGSQYGLHRFDGYHFTSFHNNPLDSNSIASDYVEYIYVAKDGTLYIAFWGEGVDHYNPKTGHFKHFRHNPNDASSLCNDMVSVVVEDRQGYIWVGTQHGLSQLNSKTGKFNNFYHDDSNQHSLSYDMVRALYIDRAGVLWVGTGFIWDATHLKPVPKKGTSNGIEMSIDWQKSVDGGLNKYIPETGRFVRYQHENGNPNSLSNNKIRAIFEDSKGNFWIGAAGDGLHKMDRKTGKFIRYQNTPGNPTGFSAPKHEDSPDWHITAISEDQDGWLWICDWRGGIKRINLETGEWQHFTHNEANPLSLPENAAWTMLQAKDGSIWMSTAEANGRVSQAVMSILNPFHQIPLSLNADIFQAFCESSDGRIWIGKREGLLEKINLNNGEEELLLGGGDKFLTNISCIKEDKQGILWLTSIMKGNGLISYNPRTGKIRQYKHNPNDPSSLSNDVITKIILDGKNNLWVATMGGGLDYFDQDKGTFKHHIHQPKNVNSLAHDYISNMYLAKNGDLWLGCAGYTFADLPVVVSQFKPASTTFKHYTLPHKSYGKQARISGIQEDNKGHIWFTMKPGLFDIDIESGQVNWHGLDKYDNEFADVKGMVIDGMDKIWIIAENLLLFNPENKTIFSYGASSGVKFQPFQFNSIYRTHSGKVLFGGRGGLQIFDPLEMEQVNSNNKPEVIITAFEMFNQPVKIGSGGVLTSNIWDTPEIRLNYNQNVFSFRFALLDFINRDANRHEFMLEPYDEKWRVAGSEPIASYFKVPTGNYTFRVRAANHLGQWSAEKSVRVIISPPFWATWWAYTLYAMLICAALYLFYRFQIKRRLELAETLRLQELDAVKTKLYANITHEFRTPLTIILGMARQVKLEIGNWKIQHLEIGKPIGNLDMIIRNGQNLLALVNQMLDLSKLESGKLNLHYQQGDVVNFLKYQIESQHSFAEQKGVKLHFLPDFEAFVMDFDGERLQQVISNLLTNAIKFTPTGGDVYFSVGSPNRSNGSNSLVLKIRDTGIGISDEHLPRIFDRFYQANDTQTYSGEGTGIGLALTRELVKLMDGEIIAKSKLGHGAEFLVTLPVRNVATPSTVLPVVAPKSVLSQLPPLSSFDDEGADLQKPLLLLAEDNSDMAVYLSSCLSPHYRLTVARDGQAAIDMALELIPDLLVTDVMMPHKNGFEVCAALRKDQRTSHVPIVMLTAKSDRESQLEGYEHGADAYLTKPFHEDELLVRIRKLLELRQQLQHYYQEVGGLIFTERPAQEVQKMSGQEDYFMKKVRTVVDAHLDDSSYTIEKLCQEVGISHTQLHRKLIALTGFSTNKFIRTIRLNKAKELLQNQALSITSIALDTGFYDASHFGKVFKQEFGLTPMEWREQNVGIERGA